MKIIPLSEGSFTIDQTKLFVPFTDGDELQARAKGSLLVEVQPFIVITSKDILLLDTGLGFNNANSGMQLKSNIADAGINSDDITKVLLTHLHKDHAGGISHNNELSFPRATYFLQQKELDYAFEKGMPSYITDELEPLNSSSNVVKLSDDKGVIDGYIDYEITGAHSKYHQVFTIKDEGETIFFGGDDAPQLQQMKHRYAAKYDLDGKKAMELRRTWWEQGEKEGWTFLFYHDIKTPFYKRSV